MSVTIQAVLAFLMFGTVGISLFWLVDWVMEQVDNHMTRESQWKAIEVRGARERHPSYRAPMFDQDNPF